MLILALNSGSSSLKCAAIEPDTGDTPFTAIVERVGGAEATLATQVQVQGAPVRHSAVLGPADHGSALRAVLSALQHHSELWSRLAGVGHRVVHGGETFSSSCLIDDGVIASVEQCVALAPLHNPANLSGILAARGALPHVPHVAVFDTAFHQTLEDHAYRYATPDHWYTEYGVRRYGFHGTSHRYVTARAAELLGRPLEDLSLLSLHLGNGCSGAAVREGRCVDTTMGFTPLEGLVMGTRSGDLDPSIVFYLHNHVGMSLAEIHHALNHESGLLGLSGLTHDMRELTEASPHDPRARLAVSVFCHRLAKYVAALATSLPRLDGVVFTGGIGEHSALVRRRVCERLELLGIRLDEAKNACHERRADDSSSNVPILIIPTNEELMIARDTRRLIAKV